MILIEFPIIKVRLLTFNGRSIKQLLFFYVSDDTSKHVLSITEIFHQDNVDVGTLIHIFLKGGTVIKIILKVNWF